MYPMKSVDGDEPGFGFNVYRYDPEDGEMPIPVDNTSAGGVLDGAGDGVGGGVGDGAGVAAGVGVGVAVVVPDNAVAGTFPALRDIATASEVITVQSPTRTRTCRIVVLLLMKLPNRRGSVGASNITVSRQRAIQALTTDSNDYKPYSIAQI